VVAGGRDPRDHGPEGVTLDGETGAFVALETGVDHLDAFAA
jgi:hypothetical protein